MYNARYIIPALIIFVAMVTSPFWLNMNTEKYEYPKVVLPSGPGMEECIEDVEYMRANHMKLLNEWRDEALRNGNRIYVASDGKKWEISLQNTCMTCHANYEDFCQKCHDVNSVDPYCWSCHIKPQGN